MKGVELMKKIYYLLVSVIFAGLSLNMAMGLSTPDYPYYDCPSMEKYSPIVTASSYCAHSQPMKPSEYSACVKNFKNLYSAPKLEYRAGKCKLSDVRYTQISYGSSACKVEYTLTPEPKILSTTGGSNDICTRRLKSALLKAYPKMK